MNKKEEKGQACELKTRFKSVLCVPRENTLSPLLHGEY